MNGQYVGFREFFAASLAMLGIWAAALPVAAQDPGSTQEINIEEIRKELAQARTVAAEQTQVAQPPLPHDKKDFVLGDQEIQARNEQLVAQEAKLLQELMKRESEASAQSAPQEAPAPDVQKVSGSRPETVQGSAESGVFAEQADVTREAEGIKAALQRHSKAVVVEDSESAPSTGSTLRGGSIESVIEKTLVEPHHVVTQPQAEAAVAAGLGSEAASLPSVKKADNSAVTKVSSPAVISENRTRDTRTSQELSSLRLANANLSAKVASLEKRNSQLASALEEAKSRVMLAETEVERLSSVVEARNRGSFSRLGLPSTGTTARSVEKTVPSSAIAPLSRPPAALRSSSKVAEDMPVATVVAEKANLRTGAGTENSPLMSVTRGTRLVVETRRGEWYRVIAPTGARAWVNSDVVSFGPQASTSSNFRMEAQESNRESDNFRISGSGSQ